MCRVCPGGGGGDERILLCVGRSQWRLRNENVLPGTFRREEGGSHPLLRSLHSQNEVKMHTQKDQMLTGKGEKKKGGGED